MRHRVAGKKLGRDASHRKALLKNLATSMVEKGSVTTTLAKAKYAKPFIEKAVTKAKNGKIRELKKVIVTEDMVRKILSEVAPKFEGRAGGYLRLIKLGRRDGDNAAMARLEWVEDIAKPEKKSNAKKAEVKSKEVVEETKADEKEEKTEEVIEESKVEEKENE